MRVITKKEQEMPINNVISTHDIVALDTGTSTILTEPVKNYVTIVYDSLGYPDVTKVNLGVQYDHRVTWLHFVLDDLIWHLNEESGYTQDTKFQRYNFKLAFTRINNHITEDTSVWEFDGVDFEVPRSISKQPGLYRIVLIIDEYTKDGNPGNIDSKEIERFISSEIRGRITESCYTTEREIIVEDLDTHQKAALIKPTIQCSLTDEGDFIIDTLELGQQFDSAIRYFKFNPKRITAHLNDFTVLAIFKQNEKYYASKFERTDPDDPLDDYSAAYPIIAWIPADVYKSAGDWEVCIIAYTGNLDYISTEDLDNGDYYFYVSKTIRTKVQKNFLTEEDINMPPHISVTTNLLSGAGELIMTSDDDIYQTKRRGKE